MRSMVLTGWRKATTAVMLSDEPLVSASVARRFAHMAGSFTASTHPAYHLSKGNMHPLSDSASSETNEGKRAANCQLGMMLPAQAILDDEGQKKRMPDCQHAEFAQVRWLNCGQPETSCPKGCTPVSCTMLTASSLLMQSQSPSLATMTNASLPSRSLEVTSGSAERPPRPFRS